MPIQPTLALARFVERSSATSLPTGVVHEAKRAILNWVGCAVGASQHATVSRALAALRPFMGPPQATVLGRGERVDILHAAMLNGISSHTFDFDDTHLKTVIHPAGPVASAILAFAEYRTVSDASCSRSLPSRSTARLSDHHHLDVWRLALSDVRRWLIESWTG